MGRPKKEQGAAVDAVEEKKTEEVAPEVEAEKKLPPLKLKDCPRCDSEGPKKATEDANGNYRCFCPTCSFWDSMVYLTPREAEIGWNAAGGPVRGE